MDGQDDANPEIVALPQTRSRILLMPKKIPPKAPPKQIRRRSSFIRRVDSSEESPSPHGSIFEALYHSTTNSEDSVHFDSLPTRHLPISSRSVSPSDPRDNDENTKQQQTSKNVLIGNENQFLYGRGTLLETITERTSLGSIRIIARAKSADNFQNDPPLDRHESFGSEKSPQRKKSLSMDDLDLIKDSCDQQHALDQHETQNPLEIHEVYAQPRTPIQEPPHRLDTPPGMPSWTEHQLRPPQLRPGLRTSISFRQFFSIRSSGTGATTDGQDLPSGRRSASAPVGAQAPRIARFRPPRSAYSPIDQHPFNRAPTAAIDPFLQQPVSVKASGKRKVVRFTPSTTAQDTEVVPLQTEIEQGCFSSPHANSQIGSNPNQSAPSSASPVKQRDCPHRKGRHAAFNRLKHSDSTLTGIDYQAILSHPLIRERSHASLPRPPPPSPTHPTSSGWPLSGESNWYIGVIDTEPISGACSTSSTTHLMSGALIAPSPSPTHASSLRDNQPLLHLSTKNKRCWRCKLESLGQKLARIRNKGAGCLWFVCCGFDSDEDSSSYPPRSTTVEMGGQVTEFGRGDRGREHWIGVAESPLGPGRRIVSDNTQPWIV